MNQSGIFFTKIKYAQPEPSKEGQAIYVHHDQLNLSAFPKQLLKERPVLIFIESKQKGWSRPYHKKKLVYLLSSLRNAALEAVNAGFEVIYWLSSKHYDGALLDIISAFPNLKISAMYPTEIDSRKRLQKVRKQHSEILELIPNTFFIADPAKWSDKIKNGYRLEYFYRELRKQTGYLMQSNKPEGGKWNYDYANRKSVPNNYTEPEPFEVQVDEITKEVIDFVKEQFPKHFGEIEDFNFAVTRKQALLALDHFVSNKLFDFGKYEDAMKKGADFLNHSILSLYLNNGLLRPVEVCNAVTEAYKRQDETPIESVEGFIRQVIGWREYIRCYYETFAEEIHQFNHFQFKHQLPSAYWKGDSGLQCVDESVKNVRNNGYAHHIQRLMVLSNFANLTHTNPYELNEWFWYAFVDAYDWVTSPNVFGMSTFADGGILASKPYVSSGSYINKMSDYCKHCKFKVKDKLGEEACPLNYLYWNFVSEQEEVFKQNARVGFMVNMYHKKSSEEKAQIKEQSRNFINKLPRYN